MQPGRTGTLTVRRGHRTLSMVCLAVCLLAPACRRSHEPWRYLGPGKPKEYLDRATSIAYPDLEKAPDPNVMFSVQPRTVRQQTHDDIWDLSLAECLQITLTNSQVIRNQAQFLNPQNPVLVSPDSVSSRFDPAIQESGVLYGQRGVEAALSDFDTQFTTSMIWGRNETVQNNTLSSGLLAGDVLTQETGAFSSGLQKRLATGGQIAITQSWNYTGNNVGNPPQLFPSVYEGTAQLQFRQPLLAGGGTEYTRIAGPVSSNIQGVTGVQQGVLIARINDDMALAEFERSVHQMIHDVETLYWQLHLAYRSYAVQIEAREAALEAWRRVDSQIRGLTGPGGAQEAEFRDNFLSISGQAETARDSIYAAEAQLRLLMGLPVNDGRVIRPSDSPVTAEFIPDWTLSLSDAFANRPEIRRQKWSIRSLDLQRRAAMNLTQPRLDFVSGYQINGFGDDLYNIGNGSAGRYPGAVENLLSNKETGWNLGFEFSVPIGRRFAFAQVRTLELRLAKAQEMLSQQEVEISHEVAAVFRDIDRNYVSLQNAYNRLLAARDRMRLAQAQYHNDPTQYTIDTIVRAQQALAQAELSFATSLVQYNTALADLQYRTGRTLLSNNIHLMEGPWVDEATTDALHQFDAREHGVDADWIKHPQPEPLSTPGVTTGAVFLPASVEPRTSEPEPVPATPLPAPPAPDDLIFPPAPLERASFEP